MQIWDVGRMKQIRALKGHSARVSALAWSGTTLSSGGRDSNIINHDVRCDNPFCAGRPLRDLSRPAPLAGQALRHRAFSHAHAVCRCSGCVWGMVVLLAFNPGTDRQFDLFRIREHITGVLRGHEQEVCGLKWSPSGTQLASGGNDNLLHIWSATGASTAHSHRRQHPLNLPQ